MLLEIARFWASVTTFNEETGRYEILKVMGPDEYHDAYPDSDEPGLDNNAYTNVMAVWVISKALKALQMLPEGVRYELCNILDLHSEEIERWDDITKKMTIVFHDGDIISQFEGFEKLQEFPWDEYRQKYGNIQRLDRILEAEGSSANKYQVAKQADVLMLFYLFSSEELQELFIRLDYSFDKDVIPRNIEYYLARVSHGSTLSSLVHSWVMARADRVASWELLNIALESDVADVQGGTTREGIHLGAMAGTVDIIQRCYTGIYTRDDVLWFDPYLPEAISCLKLCIHYRGHSLKVFLTENQLEITAQHTTAAPIAIGFCGSVYEIASGEVKTFGVCPTKSADKVPGNV